MCVCECFIASKSLHSYLLTWHELQMKHLKEKIHNAQNRRSGELSSRFYETFKNSVKPHGCHIHITAVYMDMAKMRPFPSHHHGLPTTLEMRIMIL